MLNTLFAKTIIIYFTNRVEIMKFKHVLLISFLLVILTVSAASAADINETSNDAIGIDMASSEVNGSDNEIFQSSANDDILATGEGSFSEVQSMINGASDGDTIVLSKDYLGSGTNILVNKEVTIDGNNATFDANCASRIFYVTSSNVVIKNINFINGNSTSSSYYDGGAIRWEGANGTVLNCSFDNCSASKDGGGAIQWEGTNGSVLNSHFMNCHAYDTGAIMWAGANGSVADCIFENCFVTYYGAGAIEWYFKAANGQVYNCSFINCSSIGGSGAITYRSDNGSALNCTFTNCSGSSAGAIMCDSAYVEGCSFVNCYSPTGEAGAIIWFDDGGYISNCSFVNCYYGNHPYSNSGGVVDIWNENQVISNCKFESDYIDDFNIPIRGGVISNCTVNGISVTSFEYLQSLINNSTDTLIIGHDYYGNGTHIIISKNMTINGAGHTLDGNELSRIFEITAENVTLKNIVFKNGYSDGYGGAVYFTGNGNVTNCNFNDNKANGYYSMGGAIWMSSGTVTDCNFANNYVSFEGGAIWMYSGTVTNCNFSNNTAPDKGCAVSIHDEGNFTKCSFTDNKATGDYCVGGAVYFTDDSSGSLIDCNFTNNTATVFGGAIYLDHSSTAKAVNCNFIKNSAKQDGGAIYVHETCTVTVTNCNFTNNSASRYGGAVYFGSEGSVTNCKFSISNSGFDINNSTSLETVIFRGTLSNCTINGEPVNTINDTKFETRTILSVNATHLSIGEKISIIADVLNETNVNGSVDVFINGILIETVNSGVKYVHVPNEIGTYSIMAKFKGDANYTQSQSANKTFTVGPKVSIEQNVSVGENGRVEMEFDKNITDILVIKIDGDTFAVADIDEGIINCTFSTSKLTARNHTVTFAYERALFDANVLNYFDESAKQYLPVEYEMYLSPKTSSQDTEVKNNNTVIMQVGENATGVVKVFVNGAEVMIVEIVNGIAIIDLSAYKDGNYDITFVYSGDDIYEGFTMEIELKNPKINAKNTNALYTAGQKYSVTVYDRNGTIASGVQVIFKIGKKQVGKANTDTKGVATYKVTNVPGSYKITATALGASTTKTLTVKHLVTLKTVTVKRSAKKLILTATLSKVNKKYLKNKKITFKFNGKKYTAKTNKKGVAKVTIKSTVLKKLKADKKVTYQATYLKDTVKKTVKIKK